VIKILVGDALDRLKALPDKSVNCCVTSPPYFGLRDYGIDGQIGRETSPEAFVDALVAVFREVRRVLRDDGTLWINIGDSFARNNHQMGYGGGAGIPAGVREKEQIGIPWMLAFALRRDGWMIRQENIWNKVNGKPEPVRDRCVAAHEQLFLITKGPRYHFDAKAIEEEATCDRVRGPALHPDKASTNGNSGLSRRQPTGKRNKRSVWSVQSEPFAEAHFATYPPALIEPCILAGCPKGGAVLDPFGGAGTTGLVADRLGREAILIELNPDYAALAERRLKKDGGMLTKIVVE
jgi:DNA modification methylase